MFTEQIKAALKKAGYSEDLAKFITVTTAEEVDGAVTAFAALLPAAPKAPTTLAEVLADPTLKAAHEAALKSETDRRINLLLKKGKVTQEPGEPTDPADPDPETARILKVVGPLLGEIKGLITGQQAKAALEDKKAAALAALTAKKLSPKLVDLMNLEGEATVEAEVARVEGVFNEQLQDFNNAILAAGGKPGNGKPGEGVADAAIIAVAKSRGENAAETSGFNVPKDF